MLGAQLAAKEKFRYLETDLSTWYGLKFVLMLSTFCLPPFQKKKKTRHFFETLKSPILSFKITWKMINYRHHDVGYNVECRPEFL